MAKSKSMLSGIKGFVLWLLMILISLAIAGLFLDGSTASGKVLGWLPQAVHTFTGWLIVVLVALGVVMLIVDYTTF